MIRSKEIGLIPNKEDFESLVLAIYSEGEKLDNDHLSNIYNIIEGLNDDNWVQLANKVVDNPLSKKQKEYIRISYLAGMGEELCFYDIDSVEELYELVSSIVEEK